jgi:hypothetical protein
LAGRERSGGGVYEGVHRWRECSWRGRGFKGLTHS